MKKPITPEELDEIHRLLMENRASPDFEEISRKTGRTVLTLQRINRVIKSNAIQYRTKAAARVRGHQVPKWTSETEGKAGAVALEVVGLRKRMGHNALAKGGR